MHDDDVALLLDELGRSHRYEMSCLTAQAAVLRELCDENDIRIPDWITLGHECLRRVRRAFLELDNHNIRDPEQPRDLSEKWTLFAEGADPREPSQLVGAEGL